MKHEYCEACEAGTCPHQQRSPIREIFSAITISELALSISPESKVLLCVLRIICFDSTSKGGVTSYKPREITEIGLSERAGLRVEDLERASEQLCDLGYAEITKSPSGIWTCSCRSAPGEAPIARCNPANKVVPKEDHLFNYKDSDPAAVPKCNDEYTNGAKTGAKTSHCPSGTDEGRRRARGLRIQELADARGLSQRELAKTSGVSRGALRRIVAGEVAGQSDALVRLAEALGVESVG